MNILIGSAVFGLKSTLGPFEAVSLVFYPYAFDIFGRRGIVIGVVSCWTVGIMAKHQEDFFIGKALVDHLRYNGPTRLASIMIMGFLQQLARFVVQFVGELINI